jgi:glycerol kinase
VFQTGETFGGAALVDYQHPHDVVMAASDWTMQFLADICDAPVDRPPVLETTALGAAWLAGMRAGIYPAAEAFAKSWRSERRFEPAMAPDWREQKLAGWQDAVRRTLSSG